MTILISSDNKVYAIKKSSKIDKQDELIFEKLCNNNLSPISELKRHWLPVNEGICYYNLNSTVLNKYSFLVYTTPPGFYKIHISPEYDDIKSYTTWNIYIPRMLYYYKINYALSHAGLVGSKFSLFNLLGIFHSLKHPFDSPQTKIYKLFLPNVQYHYSSCNNYPLKIIFNYCRGNSGFKDSFSDFYLDEFIDLNDRFRQNHLAFINSGFNPGLGLISKQLWDLTKISTDKDYLKNHKSITSKILKNDFSLEKIDRERLIQFNATNIFHYFYL